MYTKDCFLTELRIKDVCIITVARSSIIAFINCEKDANFFICAAHIFNRRATTFNYVAIFIN